MQLQNLIYSLFFLLFFSSNCWSQDTLKKKKSTYKESKISTSGKKLEQSLGNNNEAETAENYEKLAKEFEAKGDKQKAEEYLKKAQAIYAKRNESQKLNLVSRSLAKNQESQKDFDGAAMNYKIAVQNASTPIQEKINSNDLKRVENIADPKAQELLLDDNIKIADKSQNKADIADSYVQKAAIQAATSNVSGAVTSYNSAISYSTKPLEIIKIKNEIAKVYAEDGAFEKALTINKNLISEAEKTKDLNTQITQLQAVAKIYFQKNEPENALISLRKSYEIATKSGNTQEVKNSLSKLLSYYKSTGNQKESILLYESFLKNFDQIIQKDSSLIDSKNFQVIEKKIQQLEKEKSLTDELISKKNRFNYFLIVAFLLLLLFFGFIAKALFSIKKKNKKIALQSLRREMNPHFIFNSLNSVNQFISENKELEANKYLTSYSNLMRTTMENSNKDFIVLNVEIEQLTKYLNLEHLRFQDKFDFKIILDNTIDSETILVPNMILQPHLENAIWHGLRYLDKKGKLELRFETENKKIKIVIEDDGIGLSQSKLLKTINQKTHKSRGMKNTMERIELLNNLYQTKIELKIIEKSGGQTGTIVEITYPEIDKIK